MSNAFDNSIKLIGAARVVDSIAALRAVKKGSAIRAIACGHAIAGDAPERTFIYDATDTTTADNGVTVIVAADGGRWKWTPPAEGIDARYFGAKFDGSTDDTAALQAAFTFGKNLILPPLTACVSSTVSVVTPMTIQAYGATLKWIGAAPGARTPVIKIGNGAGSGEAAVSKYGLFGLTVNCQNTNYVCGFHFTTCRYSAFGDLTVNNSKGTNGLGFYFYPEDTVGLNCADNVFRQLTTHDCSTGMLLSGIQGSPSTVLLSVTTVNQFHGVNLFGDMTIGIDFRQNCDSNQFYGVSILSQSASLLTACVFNSGPSNTTQYNDVTNMLIDGLLASGGTGGILGCAFNHCQDIVIRGAFFAAYSGSFNQYIVYGPTSVVNFTLETITQGTNNYKVTPPPTAAAGAAAGTSPPAPVVVAGATYHCGQITFGTGTAPAAGVQVAVTFPSVGLPRAPKAVKLQALNGITAALNLLPTGVTSTGFSVWASNAPSASQANTAYSFYYSIDW